MFYPCRLVTFQLKQQPCRAKDPNLASFSRHWEETNLFFFFLFVLLLLFIYFIFILLLFNFFFGGGAGYGFEILWPPPKKWLKDIQLMQISRAGLSNQSATRHGKRPCTRGPRARKRPVIYCLGTLILRMHPTGGTLAAVGRMKPKKKHPRQPTCHTKGCRSESPGAPPRCHLEHFWQALMPAFSPRSSSLQPSPARAVGGRRGGRSLTCADELTWIQCLLFVSILLRGSPESSKVKHFEHEGLSRTRQVFPFSGPS